MNNVIGELLPVFILIVIGWSARAAGIVSAEGFGAVNRFGYFVLYPAFLFTLSSSADLSGGEAGPFILGILLGFGVMIAPFHLNSGANRITLLAHLEPPNGSIPNWQPRPIACIRRCWP